MHRLVALPWIYDTVQFIVGSPLVFRRLVPILQKLAPRAVIVDLGGGTGLVRRFCPLRCKYICVDMDLKKLHEHRRRHAQGLLIVGDVTRAPIKTLSVDATLCTNMSHHLGDEALIGLVRESRRILKDSGFLLFVDAIWNPARLVGRLLWKYDRGANPRTSETLYSTLSGSLRVVEQQRIAVYHEYALFVGTKPNPS